MRTLIAITAGLSTPSTTRQVADAISDAAKTAISARGESAEVITIELSDLIPDITSAFSTGVPAARLDEVKRQLSAADGLIAVTPVFKANYSGLFKMFFDLLDTDALNGMPTIIAATAGTPRHSLVTEFGMRPLLTYMRAHVVPTSIFAATEDFGSAVGAALTDRIQRAAGELADLIVAEVSYSPGFGGATVEPTHRPRSAGVDLDGIGPSFTDLLAQHDGQAKQPEHSLPWHQTL